MRVANWIVFSALLAAVACKPKSTTSPDDAEALAARIAALRAHVAEHPDDGDAWRDLGHLYWLHAESPAEAVPIFDRLSAQDDPVARLSRAVIADARMEYELVVEHTTALLRFAAFHPDDRTAVQLAEPAARLLAGALESVRNGDDVVVALTNEIDERKLSPEAAQRLISLRASIDRRKGRDYRQHFAAQGCTQAWEIGRPEGRVGTIDLARRNPSDGGFVRDDAAVVGELACTVRVHNPLPQPIVRRMQTVIDAPTGALVIELAAQQPMRAYLDGQLILATDGADRAPASHHWFDVTVAPGPHELEIHVVIPDTRTWVLSRVTSADGVALTTRPGGLEPMPAGDVVATRRVAAYPAEGTVASDIYDPWRTFLRLEDALADGDDYRAGVIVRKQPKLEFASGQLLLARHHRRDGSRPRALRDSDAAHADQAALDLDEAADRARLSVLDTQLDRGEGEAVVAALERVPAGRLESIEADLFRMRVFLERGSEALAEAALEQAEARDPKACAVLAARRNFALRHDKVAQVDELTRKLKRCAGTAGLRARWAIERDDTELARKLWRLRLDRAPDDVDVLESLADLAIARREYDEASELHEKILGIAPYRLSSHVERADLLAHGGAYGPARDELAAAIERLPHVSRLREMGRAVGLADDLWTHRVDAAPVIADYRARNVDYDGAGEVLVLDRDVARVYENGGQRHIVHQVVHLLSKPALDSYGELVPPDSATVLTLQSIKPDGTVLEPELVPGKDGLSLRHLEVGDLVEYEYLIDVDPVPSMPDYVDLSRFRFQSLDEPYHRSELVVLHPQAMPMKVESRNGAPQPVVGESKGVRTLTFRADEMPRKGGEPHHRSLIDELPMVRVHTPMSLEQWLDMLSEQLWAAQRANADLESQTRKLVRKHDKERDKLHALWSWVMENVEDDGDLSTPATRTLAQRRGDRLMLLRAMLNVAGVRSQLWLVRDKFGARRVDGGHPMPESFDSPALAVWPDGSREPVVVMTIARNMPLGYLAPSHSASEALGVWLAPGDEPSGLRRVPASPSHLADRRAYQLTLRVDDRGQGTLEGAITLHGIEAIQWRQILEEVDADRISEVFQQSELGPLLPGATLDLDELDLDHVDEINAPLVLTFRAKASGVGAHQSGELAIPSMLVPMNQGLAYTRLPSRWSGLLIPYAPELEARVEIELLGTRLTAVPPPESMQSPYGTYERTIEGGGVGQSKVVVRTKATLTEGIVEASMYDELAAFTRGVTAAERAVLRAR